MAELGFEKCIRDGVNKAMKECELIIGMTLKEAVEKQIPKTPDINGYLICPACRDYLRYLDKYCSVCGQRIDWEAVDDE